MELGPQYDYRTQLRREMLDRMEKNSQYSQNAFAGDLGVSRSFLSRILSGERHLTEGQAVAFFSKLSWSQDEKERFLILVRLNRVSLPSHKQALLQQLQTLTGEKISYQELKEEQFKLISEWYHGAILEMIKMDDFRPDSTRIAKKLGISPMQVEIALERLQLLNLIRKTDDGFSEVHSDVFIHDIPSRVIRKFHTQHLTKALASLESSCAADRNVAGVTFAGDKDLIDEANNKIDKFNRDLMKFMESGKKRNGLYHLTVSMIRLDKESAL
jgi:uncharacterized protein (TIGR02147 family)